MVDIAGVFQCASFLCYVDIRGFHEYTKLAALALLPTLYSNIFAVSILTSII